MMAICPSPPDESPLEHAVAVLTMATAATVTVVPSRSWEGFGLVALESLAAEIGYFGAVRVMVGIACAVPGQNLELRVYDELCGDNLRPAAGYTHFEPIVLDYPGLAERV